MSGVVITGKDFDRLAERACAAIRKEGINGFSAKCGLSPLTLRRILKTGSLGNMRGFTAVRLIAALKTPPSVEERLEALEGIVDRLEGDVQDLKAKGK